MDRKGRRTQLRSSWTGFSLVELLVSMAIIAVLVSMLVPAVGRARDQSRLIQCKGRLRSIHAAVLMYADTNAGVLPIDETVDNPHIGLTAALSSENYLVDGENYYCPSATASEDKYSEASFEAGEIGYFYFSCRRATKNGAVSKFLRKDVAWPRILRTITDAKTWVISDQWFRGRPTPHRFFKKGVNYTTMDGSVHMVYRSPRQEFR